MFVDFRIDLSGVGLAFVAALVLGVVLVLLPAPTVALLQEAGWLLPAAACLAVGARSGGSVR
ncbi:hypothetical protein [Streptomyces himalayensis]|uniref:Uncharacterized protein n=1 Tax=Streptomyces himalayensis subsp. himalayensis TaxID=2756131 RepID=A0A7W0ICU8_9ACTN|nr:hypothetical protein [Streptomyces himalayensis]MBA2951035.1 hypothetical protein [Streptomyces himalayensis subsp. himalayensis]